MSVVVIGALTEDQPQVPLANGPHPIQTLANGSSIAPAGSSRVRFGYGIGDYQEAATAAGRLAERVEDITAAETLRMGATGQ